MGLCIAAGLVGPGTASLITGELDCKELMVTNYNVPFCWLRRTECCWTITICAEKWRVCVGGWSLEFGLFIRVVSCERTLPRSLDYASSLGLRLAR